MLLDRELKLQGNVFDDLVVDTERGGTSGSVGSSMPVTALDWLLLHQADLQQMGFKIIQEHLQTPYFIGSTSLTFNVAEGNDWFDIHAIAHFGEYQIPFLQLRNHILEGHRTFQLPNGEIAIIPEEWFARYPQLFRFSQNKQGLRLKKHHLGLLDEISSFQEVTMERKLEKL